MCDSNLWLLWALLGELCLTAARVFVRAGVNKKPPPSVAGDMFAEMAWKKKQKEAKKAWEDAKG